MHNDILDCIVIGAGPAGLTAAIYLKRANINSIIIEKGPYGGKVNYTSMVNNYLGFQEVSGPDLAEKFYIHAMENGVEIISDEIVEVSKNNDMFIVKSTDEEYHARSVIVASGTEDKKLNLENAYKFEHKGISYCAICDGPLYKNKVVAIIGGGNSALEEALYLANITQKVYLIHRRNEFRGDKALIDLVKKNTNIELVMNANVIELKGENKLEAIALDNGQTLNVEALFPYIGQIPNYTFLKFDNLSNESGYIIVNSNMETSIDGLFAAGDVTNNELKQIATASGNGAVAAQGVISYLRR